MVAVRCVSDATYWFARKIHTATISGKSCPISRVQGRMQCDCCGTGLWKPTLCSVKRISKDHMFVLCIGAY